VSDLRPRALRSFRAWLRDVAAARRADAGLHVFAPLAWPDRRGDGVTLTASQEAVLMAIRSLIDKHGYSPSVREIGVLVGMRSSSTVHGHIEALKRKGLVRQGVPGAMRTLVLASGSADA